MELDFKRNCTEGLSPNTVLPPQQHFFYTGRSSSKRRTTVQRDYLLGLKDDFIDINFTRYRSASSKSIPSRPFVDEGCKQVRRDSVYQSSNEVRKIKKMGSSEGRRKIEISGACDATFSSGHFDSLCGSDVESSLKRSPTSLGSNIIPPSIREPNSSDGFIEIGLDLVTRGINAIETVGEGSLDVRMRSDVVVGPVNNGNELLERDAERTFHKSLSSKLEMPHSPSQSESDCSSKTSSKTMFTPIRKMFDPFMKSKSLRSPSSYVVEPGEVKISQKDKTRMNKTYRKSLLHDFSVRAQDLSCKPQHIKKDENQLSITSSPVHLRGYLKLEDRHGRPYFEFSVKCPEDVFVAKTWKANDAFNWVYTFHSVDVGKKSNASRCGLYESDKDSSMVGQMQVSCHLCSELKDGVFNNSMVTEFVLYDIAHARLSISSQESSNFTTDAVKLSKDFSSRLVGQTLQFDDGTHINEVKPQEKHVSTDSEIFSTKPYPWASSDLHPHLEIATIVMQFPFEKRESLKNQRDGNTNVKAHKNLLNLLMAEQMRENLHNSRSTEKVKVIIPSGNHGSPGADSQGPSSLLDRWRLGGGCDCGGWDMACPLIILGNPHLQCADNQPIVENQQPLELFVQGRKENTPALTMIKVEEGLYAVDFHAQLSTLQAFSICVAILHGTETSSSCAREEKSKQLSPCNALKVLIEEEVKFLIEAVTAEEKKKVMNRVKEIPPCYVLNPPFSPIARV